MKKIKLFSIIFLALVLFGGIIFRTVLKAQKTEKSEFLFDTVCTITVFEKNADKALEKAFNELSRLHSLTDFFDENSDVSKINKAKENEMVHISSETLEIINSALKVCETSGGAFDITVAPVSKLWKFDAENPVPPNKETIAEALLKVGSDSLALDMAKRTVSKKNKDTQIDLGGAAKGYAGDMAVKILKECGINSGIVDLGGNITCFGENPNSKDGKWRIGLQTPFAPTGEYNSTVELSRGAVVTSGTYQRYFEYEGEMYHHIIDPKTGYPVRSEYKSVTVSMENTLLADCLATAIFVLGKEEGEGLAKKFGAEVYFN